MCKSKIRLALILTAILSISLFSCSQKNDFINPPRESGVRCWWWWLNSNVTRESITKDLEAMSDKGFSGAMIFDAGTELKWGPDNPPPVGPQFSGPEWTDLFLHALDEAKRLDLKLGLSIQSGWNLGGPNVTLDDAAKQVCWSEIRTSGPDIHIELPVPGHNHNYYRDICVLAFPSKDNKDRSPINNLPAKSGAHELGGSAPDCRFLLDDVDAVPGEEDASTNDIIDISEQMDEKGVVNWNAPDGDWTIMRFGYTPTLAHVKTSSDNWKGHVLDYLDKGAFNRYWDEVVDPLLQAAGSMAGTVLTHLETDSWECGGMNWSTQFPEFFKEFNGYDIRNYLPVMAGKIINDRAASNAFLADLRKTIAACVSENHYKTFAERAAEYGMGIQPESAGPHAAPIDGITNYSHSDIVMSEFWVPSPHRPRPENRFFVKQAASAAHIYGKKYVGAEAFTSIRKPHWGPVLWKEQKPSMDHEFCAGLNMVFFHTYTNSPDEMGEPGQEYFAGTHVNRHVTWWDLSDAFMDYIARVQHVVQEGKFVADVLYYYGDHVPNIARLKEDDPAGVLPGYDYDVTNEEIMLQLEVIDGKIVVPGGIGYQILALPDHGVLSLEAIQKVGRLLDKGATVLGPKPTRLVSLKGGKQAQILFKTLSDSLWGANEEEKGFKKIGRGNLLWGGPASEALKSAGIPRDLEVTSFRTFPAIDYIHYVIDNQDVYFISNQSSDPQLSKIRFRISGKQPEIWDPVTGNQWKAEAFEQSGGLTTIPLQFDPYGSLFVVFSDPIPEDMQGTKKSNFPELDELMLLNGPWKVEFDTARGGPESVEFQELQDWSESDDERIRYYSGEAVYTKPFRTDEIEKSASYYMELGNVSDVGIAAIEINGRNMGITWTPPFRLEISEALKEGENQLKVIVVNNWLNRLIGDKDKPRDERLTRTNIKVKDEWELAPSGLLGPVRIMEDRSGNNL